MKKNNIIFVVIVVFYSLLLASYFRSSCMWTSWCGQDMDQYMDYSTSLLTGHGYSAHNVSTMYFVPTDKKLYIPETMRLPAYPILLTVGRYFYNSPQLLIVLNCLFIGLILGYSYKLFTLFFPDRWWMLYVVLLLSPNILFYTTQLSNVDLFTYSMVTGFTFYVVNLYRGNNSFRNTCFLFIYGVGAIFSRQNTLLFIFPVCILPLVPLMYNHKLKVTYQHFIGVCIGFIFLLSLWIARNFMITQTFTLSTASSLQLFNEYTYFSLYPNKQTKELVDWLYTEKSGEIYMKEQRKKQVSIPIAFAQFNKQIQKKTTGYILSHPNEVILQFGSAVHSFLFDTTFSWQKHDVLSFLNKVKPLVNNILFLCLGLFPFLYYYQKKKDKLLIWMWIGVVTYIFPSAFFHGTVVGDRGILPLYTVVVLLSFYTMSFIFNGARNIYVKKTT